MAIHLHRNCVVFLPKNNNDYNKKGQDIVVCAITSNTENKNHGVLIDDKNLSNGTLPIKSKIRADKIIHIDKNLTIKSFAKIDNKTYDVLIEEINKIILRNK